VPRGKKLSDAYVELTVDDSKVQSQVKVKAGRVGKEFGGALNRSLKQLNIDAIDIKASPTEAVAAVELVEAKLRDLSRDAATVEIRVKAEKGLADLAKFRKRLGDVGGDAAPEVSTKLMARLGPLLASLPVSGPMGAALVGAAVSAAPLLGAAVAGGIIGGVGVGGVVGGLMLASKDTRAVSAMDALKAQLQRRLQIAAGPFIAPMLAGVKQVQGAINGIDIESIFRNSARYVAPLVNGVASAVTDIGASIERLVANAGPAVDVIGRSIEMIGETLANGLSSLADNGAEAADALATLMGIVNMSIGATLGLVNILTELYGISKKIGGDTGLQLLLKLTGSSMDDTADSAGRAGKSTEDMGIKMDDAEAKAEALKVSQEGLTAAQKALSDAQAAYKSTLDSLAPSAGRATQLMEGLKTASDNMFGAAIAGSEANEAYQASWDHLSESVKSNKATLDIHTKAGRSNRDALQDLLTSSNEMYFANIAQGQSTDSARKKHEARTASVEKEARKLGLNREETARLIKTYGQIPPNKTTDLLLKGLDAIRHALEEVYLAQRALAEGKTINQIRGGYQGNPKLFKAHGGVVPGLASSDTADNVPAMLTPEEWVIKRRSAKRMQQQHPGALEYINTHGELPPGYAAGGMVAPVDTSRSWPFRTNISNAFVMSMAEALKKVTPAFSKDWPSGPGAQRGDSGVWRKVVALIKSGPKQGSFGNAYRPGDPKWHGSGRAVDWMGFNMDALASFLASKGPLELIHRTKRRDYAYTRGRNKGSFSQGLMEAHRNHIHIAMAGGGEVPQVPIRQAVMADTGRVTLRPGLNLVGNGTGADEHLSTLGAGNASLAEIAGMMAAQNALLRRLIEVTAGNPAAFAGAMNGTGSALLQQARRW
jgi:hypothetical protein